MKLVGHYTVRGQFTSLDNTGNMIHLFDGRFDSAYRVTKFFVASTSPTDANEDCVGVLATEANLPISNAWDWSDNRQIAWASNNASTGTAPTPDGAMIDPDNLIVEDLYVYGRYDDGGTGKVNYMIHLEKYDITEGRGALALVRNNSQNVE